MPRRPLRCRRDPERHSCSDCPGGDDGAFDPWPILAIIATEFPLPSDRARAMSAYVFAAVAGGSLGLLAGGALTQVAAHRHHAGVMPSA